MRSHCRMSRPAPSSPLRRFVETMRSITTRDGLHRCPQCRRPFACPMEWETAGDDHWLIQLRCGACGEWREVLATNEEASAFDVVLDRQCDEIGRALKRIELEEMRAGLDAFVGALDHDLIDASDFAR